MNIKVEWIEGKPEKFEVGMLIEMQYPGMTEVCLVGDINLAGLMEVDDGPGIYAPSILRWAWLVKPHELAWIEDMAKQHRKGKAE